MKSIHLLSACAWTRRSGWPVVLVVISALGVSGTAAAQVGTGLRAGDSLGLWRGVGLVVPTTGFNRLTLEGRMLNGHIAGASISPFFADYAFHLGLARDIESQRFKNIHVVSANAYLMRAEMGRVWSLDGYGAIYGGLRYQRSLAGSDPLANPYPATNHYQGRLAWRYEW